MARFLITNDDGIDAPGLWALARAAVDSGAHVTVVAPDRERSATGHAITLHEPISVRPVPVAFAGSEVRAFAVGGTPADCVKLALGDILGAPPDYLVSGINPGLNLGTDVFYSGTVSAALEGSLLGVRSMAVSTQGADSEELTLAAKFALDWALLALGESRWPALVNVNVPRNPKGVRVTRLGTLVYRDALGRRTDPRGRRWYWLGGVLGEGPHEDDTDACAVMAGHVSITPLATDMTCASGMRILTSLLSPSDGDEE